MSDAHAADATDATDATDVVAGEDPVVVVVVDEMAVTAPAEGEAAAESPPPPPPTPRADVPITPELLRELATGHGDDPERMALLDRLLDDPALSEAYYDLLVQSLERPTREGDAPDSAVDDAQAAAVASSATVPTAAAATTALVTPGGTLVVPFASSRLWRWVPVAAVAVLVLVALPFMRKRAPAPVDPMAGAGTAPASLIIPANDAPLTPDVRFSWHRMQGALSYELVLIDRKGQTLQRQVTTDTLVTAAGVPPDAGAWSVTTTMADGAERTSEIRKFSASR